MEVNSIQEALEILNLPPFITKQDIKDRYKTLAKKYHPDVSKNSDKMHKINSAYKFLIEYIDNYRYSFDEDEISKQMPNLIHNDKFKP